MPCDPLDESIDRETLVSYILQIRLRLTPQFTHWLDRLKDSRDVAKIKARLIQMEAGSFGNVKTFPKAVYITDLEIGFISFSEAQFLSLFSVWE